MGSLNSGHEVKELTKSNLQSAFGVSSDEDVRRSPRGVSQQLIKNQEAICCIKS
ncbi:hypothetical protein [Rivularia sp. PCC 7116]|uniref:hypothetical protein n=1 Tax=Rivularia sp. PCC 7116 TaxID=373994 RepID=UPI0002D3A231|nr:hypothetical protein [Rivularia sp. PCC 7116]